MVYDHGDNEDRPPMYRVSASFAQFGEQTELYMTMAFASAEAAIQAKKFIKMAGGDATWDRLAEYLAKQKRRQRNITVTFTAEGDSQTRVTLAWEPFGQISGLEMATFCNARAGMAMGWTGSLDCIEAFLAAAVKPIER
jgi:hypothetical protein